jgi:hypothetical protein
MKYWMKLMIVWILCGCVSWPLSVGTNACYSGELNGVYEASVMVAIGPAGLLASAAIAAVNDLVGHRGYHFLWKPLTDEQRWQIFRRKWPNLSRYYFEHGYEEWETQCDFCK